MLANTLTDMILGFAVILGILVVYVISLILRTQKAKTSRENKPGNHHPN